MTAFDAIEIRDSGEMSPLFEAEFLEERDTRRINVEKNGKHVLYSEATALRHGMGEEAGGKPLSSAVLANIVAHFRSKPERHSAGTIGAQAAPSDDDTVLLYHINRILVRGMMQEPSVLRRQRNRRKIGCGISQGHGLIVNISDNGYIRRYCDPDSRVRFLQCHVVASLCTMRLSSQFTKSAMTYQNQLSWGDMNVFVWGCPKSNEMALQFEQRVRGVPFGAKL
ncbi:MAG: hypothetical protein PVH19_13025 [Planctomycetia bacterium]